jgi:hypothetical protein
VRTAAISCLDWPCCCPPKSACSAPSLRTLPAPESTSPALKPSSQPLAAPGRLLRPLAAAPASRDSSSPWRLLCLLCLPRHTTTVGSLWGGPPTHPVPPRPHLGPPPSTSTPTRRLQSGTCNLQSATCNLQSVTCKSFPCPSLFHAAATPRLQIVSIARSPPCSTPPTPPIHPLTLSPTPPTPPLTRPPTKHSALAGRSWPIASPQPRRYRIPLATALPPLPPSLPRSAPPVHRRLAALVDVVQDPRL